MARATERKSRMSRPQMRAGSLGFKPDRRFWEIKLLAADGDRPASAEIMIYGYIGQDTDPYSGERIGMSAQCFVEELREIPPEAPIDLRINSRGGDVYDGTAIHAVLSAHKGHKRVYVDGLAASAASLIAMAGDEVIIPSNAWMMIHDPSTFVAGTAADLAEAIKQLESTKAGVISAYAAKNAKLSEDEIGALMSATTWMTGTEAVEKGFADKVSDAVAQTNLAPAEAGDVALDAYDNVPEDLAKVDAESTDEPEARPEPVVVDQAEAAKAELHALVASLVAEAIKGQVAPPVQNELPGGQPVVPPAPVPEKVDDEAAEAARVENEARAALRREAVKVRLDARFDELAGLGATTDQLRKLVIDGAVAMAALAPTSSTVDPPANAPKPGPSVDLAAAAYDYYANINARPARAGSN